jgi:hypothetical protein
MHSSFLLASLNMKPQKRPQLSICYVNVASPRQYQTYASILREEGLENIEEARARSQPSTFDIRGKAVYRIQTQRRRQEAVGVHIFPKIMKCFFRSLEISEDILLTKT